MSTPDTFDIVILGAGSGGEVVANEMAEAGARVALVEANLVGGECPYLACVPSKAMLLAATEHRRSGSTAHARAWGRAVRRRDAAAQHGDDSGSADALTDNGVVLVRGHGTVGSRDAGGGTVHVGQRVLRWSQLVIGTGSAPVTPPIEGLGGVPTWTSDQALTAADRPDRLVVLGGGPVGCELAQVYASFGTAVTLVETAPRLLDSEQPWVGDLLERVLVANGVRVLTGVTATRARPYGAGLTLSLDGAPAVRADRLLLAGGRRPRTDNIGLERLELDLTDSGAVAVDPRCRAIGADGPLDDVFAVGDVTGVVPYTHGATYQARIVTAHLRGDGRDAVYTGVPRVVYTDPTVLCTGETVEQARARGVHTLTAVTEAAATGRAFIEGFTGPGRVELVADARTGTLIGASVLAPHADSWGGELVLAVRAQLTVGLLADVVHAFPAWAEVVQPAARSLAEQVRAL